MKGYPTIRNLARELSGHKPYIEDSFRESEDDVPGIDVRLQVRGGGWCLHTGDSSYDQDHRGCWGVGYLTRRTNCRELARELIDEARDMAAQGAE